MHGTVFRRIYHKIGEYWTCASDVTNNGFVIAFFNSEVLAMYYFGCVLFLETI